MHYLGLFSLLLFSFSLLGQGQIVRGKVVDQVSKQPLIGVNVFIQNSDPLVGTVSDENGNFILQETPLGRQIIQAQYLGYLPFQSENIIISKAKEAFVEIEMQEAVNTTDVVEVSANSDQTGGNQTLNELSVVSARSFSVEETERYAASVNDPGRMAFAFPGVRSQQDNSNDMMIHGNSSYGVLWRLEGLDIPNPSHFANPATSGGGITVFSSAVLGNSDFSSGAFAAEYGDALSGVFDMHFRQGNMMNREHRARVGVVGLDIASEGPIQKGRSSYLFNYRYSTLGILNAMGVHIVRENATNNFQDLSFNLTFNSKDNKSLVKVFGAGGLSTEEWLTIEDTSRWETWLDYLNDRNSSNLGVLGVSLRHLINDQSYIKAVAGVVYNEYKSMWRLPDFSDISIVDTISKQHYQTIRSSANFNYSYKFSPKFRIKAGLNNTAMYYKQYTKDENLQPWGAFTYLDDQGWTYIGQTYFQASYRPHAKWMINAGVNALYLSLNNTVGVDPRLAVQFKPSEKTKLSLAYGLHSKILPIGTYLVRWRNAANEIIQPNMDLKMPRAQHAVLSLQQYIGAGFRAQLELYYQYQTRIPVDTTQGSNYWFFNQDTDNGFRAMQSEGVGRNYGVDLSIDKTFGKGFFVLISSSLGKSEYKLNKDQADWQRTRMDVTTVNSIMGAKEFDFGDKGTLQLGAKAFVGGGLRYQLLDPLASGATGVLIYQEQNGFDQDYGTYFRLDTRIAYRQDKKKFSYTISLDLQNATNQKNVRKYAYDRDANAMVPDYQSSLTPILNFQIDF